MFENPEFLTKQIITYIGNKRLLLPIIEKEIITIKKKLSKDKLVTADIFSGSGIIARLFKQYSNKIFVNDLEKYSFILNNCYLANKSEFNEVLYLTYKNQILQKLHNLRNDGLIYLNYAPKDDSNIKQNERAFYTSKNAKIIDTIRTEIENIPKEMKNFFLAPLLYSASVNVNTAGIFKGFYKNKYTGIGQFGGTAKNALSRILKPIEILKPVFSNFECEIEIFNDDSNKIISKIQNADIVYIDPPYNIHPYGSNYFMLNIIAKNKIDAPVSNVSGIPNNWNRSLYNKTAYAFTSLKELLQKCRSKYIILSYNSEGLINIEGLQRLLIKFGKLKIIEVPYNTYRASRNLKSRSMYVKEFLFILEKR